MGVDAGQGPAGTRLRWVRGPHRWGRGAPRAQDAPERAEPHATTSTHISSHSLGCTSRSGIHLLIILRLHVLQHGRYKFPGL